MKDNKNCNPKVTNDNKSLTLCYHVTGTYQKKRERKMSRDYSLLTNIPILICQDKNVNRPISITIF